MKEGTWMYFLAGIGIGAGFALLWAPRSGADTRAVLRNKASEGQDFMKRQASEMRGNVTETVTDALERGRDAFRNATRAGADAMERGAAAIRQ